MQPKQLYFKFDRFGEMHDVMEAVWKLEDFYGVKRTKFSMYSCGDDHQCFCSHPDNLDAAQNRVERCANHLNVRYQIIDRDPKAFDDVFARMAGIPAAAPQPPAAGE